MNTTAADIAAAFQVGTTYAVRSMCDWDTVFRYTVTARTAKFITVDDGYSTRRVGVTITDGVEKAKPEGTYSMCPVISAAHPRA
jgi:hypothetical protein